MSQAYKHNSRARREYPQIYEKIVPVALGVIGVLILILVVITIAVALGYFPGSG